MSPSLKLDVSGASFSSLMYQMMNSKGDQEGFLFGNVRTKVTEDISDSQLNYQKEEFIIGLHQHMPCDDVYSFCNAHGIIDEWQLKKLLRAHNFGDFIGWYRFRRNTTLDVFLQERAIHQNLMKLLSNDRRSYFIFGIFTACTSDNVSTHTIEHSFVRLNERTFEPVPVTVVNLSDTTTNHYKTDPPLVLNKESGSYGDLIRSVRHPVIDNEGVTSSMKFISDIQSSIQPTFNKLCKRLSETEQEVNRLQEEIEHIKYSRKNTEINKCTDVEADERATLMCAANTIQEQISKITLKGGTRVTATSLSSKDISSEDLSKKKEKSISSNTSSSLKLKAVNMPEGKRKQNITNILDVNDDSVKSSEEAC